MKNLKHCLFIIILFLNLPIWALWKPSLSNSLQSLPVQADGRIQPLDSFARESLFFITSRKTFNKRSALDVLFSWILIPEFWLKEPFVEIKSHTLRQALELDVKKNLFSIKTILESSTFSEEIKELKARELAKEELSSYFKDLQKLQNKLNLFFAVQRGFAPGFAPPPSGSETWLSLKDMKKNSFFYKQFQEILSAYTRAVLKQNSEEEAVKSQQKLEEAGQTFKNKIIEKYPIYIKDLNKISKEVHYNNLNPFRKAWIFYLLALMFFSLKGFLKKKSFLYMGLGFSLLAFLFQGYGMLLRSLIMERPPVTNMYETVIWVPWAGVMMGAVFGFFQKNLFPFLSSLVVALFCLLLAESAPSLLDGKLSPLEAVLRSNFWLSTHVLIITMSYSAFFLAFAMGDYVLFLFLKETKKRNFQKRIKKYTKSIDRSLQAGVVLLALGTILGGIWADYSWGRFWGWDPKETWALISLIGYVAVLHGKLTGWVREWGMAVCSVLVFFLIVMAWYGVNYVLGEGLHSYGFGSGGVEYVAGFMFLHICYIFYVWLMRLKSN